MRFALSDFIFHSPCLDCGVIPPLFSSHTLISAIADVITSIQSSIHPSTHSLVHPSIHPPVPTQPLMHPSSISPCLSLIFACRCVGVSVMSGGNLGLLLTGRSCHQQPIKMPSFNPSQSISPLSWNRWSKISPEVKKKNNFRKHHVQSRAWKVTNNQKKKKNQNSTPTSRGTNYEVESKIKPHQETSQ